MTEIEWSNDNRVINNLLDEYEDTHRSLELFNEWRANNFRRIERDDVNIEWSDNGSDGVNDAIEYFDRSFIFNNNDISERLDVKPVVDIEWSEHINNNNEQHARITSNNGVTITRINRNEYAKFISRRHNKKSIEFICLLGVFVGVTGFALMLGCFVTEYINSNATTDVASLSYSTSIEFTVYEKIHPYGSDEYYIVDRLNNGYLVDRDIYNSLNKSDRYKFIYGCSGYICSPKIVNAVKI